MIKTATTIEGVNIINFGNTADRYYWCKNIGETTLYVSAKEDISPDADDVAILKSGDIVMIETYNQDIYVLGTGKIQIYESETNDCPFKLGGKGGEIPDLSAYAKTADVPNIKVNAAVDADYATNAGNAEKLGGKDASAYSTSIIKSVTFSAATTDGYIWTGIPFPKYVIGVDLGHFDVIAQFFKGSNEATARAEWTMILVSKDDLTTPLNGSFNGIIYYID